MESQVSRQQLKVGVFVALGLIFSAITIILLGGDRVSFSRDFLLKTKFSEVQGLFPGSVVSLAGLRVGNIKSIEMADDHKMNVILRISPEFSHRMTEGLLAEIKTQGALGDKYIYLKPGQVGGRALQSGEDIPVDETDFMRLLTDRQDGMARAVDLVKELHILVASLNQEGKTAKTMANMADASERLKSTLAKLDSILGKVDGQIPQDQKLQKALVSLANVMEKIDKGQGTLGQLINDPVVHQQLKTMLGGTNRKKFAKDLAREAIQTESGE